MSSSLFDNINLSEFCLITFIYLLVAFLIVLPPSELVTAGFSLQNIFAYILVESEEITFIKYHIKRISIKCLVHSCLPLGYVVLLLYYSDWSSGCLHAFLALFTVTPLLLRTVLFVCLLTPLISSCIVLRWHLNDCALHPIVRQLTLFVQTTSTQPEQTWHAVQSSIDTEFRRYDKFSCGSPTSSVRCYVLDSWILKCSMYHLNIAQQSTVRVELVEAQDIHLQETNEVVSLATQYLNILIKSYDTRIATFYIR